MLIKLGEALLEELIESSSAARQVLAGLFQKRAQTFRAGRLAALGNLKFGFRTDHGGYCLLDSPLAAFLRAHQWLQTVGLTFSLGDLVKSSLHGFHHRIDADLLLLTF